MYFGIYIQYTTFYDQSGISIYKFRTEKNTYLSFYLVSWTS